LDLSTLRVLEEALIAFPGVVCVVSHDRYFLDRVCNGIIAFKGEGELDYSVGNYSYYLEKKARAAAELEKQRRADDAAKKSSSTTTTDDSSGSSTAKPRKLSWKESKELESMEEKILEIETQIEEMEAKFMDPEFHLKHAKQTQEIQGQIEDLKSDRDALYKRWEELESIATAAKQSSQKG
jgi:ATP-binding cassette subfamily F protein uup